MGGIGGSQSVGKSKSLSQTFGQGIVRDPGTGLGGGILNQLFGAPQRISGGQFVLGSGQNAGIPTSLSDRLSGGGLTTNFADATDDQIGEFLGTGNDSTEDRQRIAEFRRQQAFQQGEAVPEGFGSEFAPILDLFNQQNPFADDFLALNQRAVADRQGQLDQQSQLFGQGAEALSGLIATGQPVDTSALAQSGLTQLKEQFAGQGGLFSSDLQSEALRLGTELNVAAQESARQRQLQAVGLGQNLGQAFAGIGAQNLDFSNQLLGSGEFFNQVATPGGRALGLFQQLGLAGGQPFSAGTDTFNLSKSKSKSVNVSNSNEASVG